MRLKKGGALRVETDSTASHIKHNDKSPENPTPAPRVDPTKTSIPKTPQKILMPGKVIPDPTPPQQSLRISLTYKTWSLAALLAIQSAPKNHVTKLAEKRRLNLFEAVIKMETGSQTTMYGYAL